MSKCVLLLERFKVNKMVFCNNDQYGGVNEIPLSPKFDIEFFHAENDDKHYKIILKCDLFDGQEEVPFTASAEVEGEFKLDSEDNSDSIIQCNAVAILLPYLRAIITQLTCLAEKKPIIMPVINVFELLASRQNDADGEIE